ncbi:MAG: hypothetical protein HN757_05145 [Calditrichaeota bacterium]|nr:hypothetical protein [Calditrichota bacterium]
MKLLDQFPNDEIEVWVLNMDAGKEWLEQYRADPNQHHISENLDMPIMYDADSAFESHQVGWQWNSYPPCYLIIDQNGIVVSRQNYINVDTAAEVIGGLLSGD